ncbi:MAG TPA: PilN domain-containing protein [Wenzhouxiangella sp.]|nr:PilN domain-containing protein [Wenzhouxiangella sp.]
MIRINLLPWREELRQQRQKNFMAAFVGTIIAAALLVFLGSYLVGKQISGQQNRNSYLQGEIKKLDRDIASIEGLEATRDSLLARKNVIEQLQENRSLMVHLFNSLATTVPEGIRLQTVGQQGSALTIKGVSESETRVSDYMSNIEAAEWLHEPTLRIIQALGKNEDGQAERFEFELRSTLASPLSVKGDEHDGGEG